MYAHLLGLLIFHWLIAPYRAPSDLTELSLVKAFHCFQKALARFLPAMTADWQALAAHLARFYQDLLRFALKSTRRKTPSTRQRLLLEAV